MGNGIVGSAPVNRVARGGVTAFFVYGVGFALTYCSQLIIARVVGVDTYGVYAFVFAWMVVLAYFSALGFDVGLLRFVPAYQAERAWRENRAPASSGRVVDRQVAAQPHHAQHSPPTRHGVASATHVEPGHTFSEMQS